MSVKLEKYISKAINKIDKASEKRLKEVGKYAEEKVKEKIDEPKTGKEYKIPGTNKTYTASAPGEAIASPKKVIRDSYGFKAKQNTTQIGSTHPFSPKFERGDFKYIEKRPTLTPVLQEEEDRFKKIMGRKWF